MRECVVLLFWGVASLLCKTTTSEGVDCPDFNVLPTYLNWPLGYDGLLYKFYDLQTSGVSTYGLQVNLTNGLMYSITYSTSCNVHYETSVSSFNSSCDNTCGLSIYLNSLLPLTKNENQSSVTLYQGTSAATTCSFILHVTVCSTVLPYNVMVSSKNNTFNSTGEFFCDNGGELFSNDTGVALTNNKTQCLENAEWKGQENLQCWKAPRVQLNMTSCPYVGGTLNLSCVYDNVIPHGNESYFYYGENFISMSIGQIVTLTITAEFDDINISCQAVTPFTQIYNETGRSQTEIIKLNGKLFEAQICFERNKDVVETESSVLLNGKQNISVDCVGTGSDNYTCVWESDDELFYRCQVIYDFQKSQTLSCTTSNCAGSVRSDKTSFVVVEERKVSIDGNKTLIVEGESMLLTCSIEYENELNTTFQWITPTTIQRKKTIFIENISRNDTGKYTCFVDDVFGKSSNDTFVDVLYPPFPIQLEVNISPGVVVSDDKILLNMTQNMTLQCKSEANPQAFCTFQLGDNGFDGVNCNFSHLFNESIDILCEANNTIGNGKSPKFHVVVVNETRSDEAQIIPSADGSVYAGGSLELNCSIPYQKDLNTKFKWSIPSDKRMFDANHPLLNLTNLTRYDRGNYTCETSDEFGNTRNIIPVNVLYSEMLSGKTDCKQSEVTNETCFITFTANPLADNFTITRNGKTYDCPNCTLENINSETQNFVFLAEATADDYVVYDVSIFALWGVQLNVTFKITKQQSAASNSNNDAIIIAASVVGGILIVALIATTVFVIRRKSRKADHIKEDRTNPLYQSGGNPDAIPDAYGSVCESGKEEHPNPIYMATEISEATDSYAEVDLSKKTKKLKEERINSIYTPCDVPLHEGEYATVNKTNKAPKVEKEEQLNPLYGTYPVSESNLHSSMIPSGPSLQTTQPDGRTADKTLLHEDLRKKKPLKPPIKKKPDLKSKH